MLLGCKSSTKVAVRWRLELVRSYREAINNILGVKLNCVTRRQICC
jgi:hypothetical protein